MVSEKAASVKSKADAVVRNSKFPPFVTFITAILAFSLSLVALLATGENGQLKQYDLLTLNTSTLFQNAVKIENTNSQRRSLDSDNLNSPESPQSTARALLPTPIEARQLPSPSDISSFFNSIGSGLASAVNPSQPTGTSSAGAGSSTGTGNFLNDLESLFNNLIGAATGAVGQEIVNVINSLIADVMDALGIEDFYSLYMNDFCSGDYTPSYESPNASKNVSKCTPLDEAIDLPTTNSTLQIGTTILDFSALNIPNKLSSASGSISAVFTAIFALQVTGIVACGILLLLAPLNILVPFFRRWIFRLAIAALGGMAAACFGTTAIIETGIMVVVSAVVNGVGEGLGIEARRGGEFLALLWVSFVVMGGGTVVWGLKWHGDRYVRRVEEGDGRERPVVKEAGSDYQIRRGSLRFLGQSAQVPTGSVVESGRRRFI